MSEDRGSRTEADAGDFERGRVTIGDVAEDDYFGGPIMLTEGGVRCGSCKGRHQAPKDVRWCYDLMREARAEMDAEAAAEAASEVAFARDREAMAERGTWFGPVTEADSWGEDDDAADLQRARNVVIHAGLASGEGDCEGGVCENIDRLCSKHQRQYQGRYGRASNE